jgi:hypothetical protein
MSIYQIIYVSLPLLAGVLGYLMNKLIFSRIDNLETKIQHTATKSEVKEYVEDKMGEIKEDLNEVKAKLDKIHDYIIYSTKRNGNGPQI